MVSPMSERTFSSLERGERVRITIEGTVGKYGFDRKRRLHLKYLGEVPVMAPGHIVDDVDDEDLSVVVEVL